MGGLGCEFALALMLHLSILWSMGVCCCCPPSAHPSRECWQPEKQACYGGCALWSLPPACPSVAGKSVRCCTAHHHEAICAPCRAWSPNTCSITECGRERVAVVAEHALVLDA